MAASTRQVRHCGLLATCSLEFLGPVSPPQYLSDLKFPGFVKFILQLDISHITLCICIIFDFVFFFVNFIYFHIENIHLLLTFIISLQFIYYYSNILSIF